MSHIDLMAFNKAMSEARTAAEQVRETLFAAAARDIVETAADFAPDATDFREAIHADGPDCDHALIAVEERFARFFGQHPFAIDIMRSSVEWDERVRGTPASRAAYAVVNEALEQAEALWAEHLEDRPAARAP